MADLTTDHERAEALRAMGLAILDVVDAAPDGLSIDDVCETIGGIMASVLVGAFAEEEQAFRDALWEHLCDRLEHQYRGMCAAIPSHGGGEA